MPCWQVGPTPGPHLIASSPRLAPRRIHTSASSSLECTTTSKNNKKHKNKSTRLHSTRAPPRARTLHSGLAWRRPRHPPRSRRSSTGGERASTAGAGAEGVRRRGGGGGAPETEPSPAAAAAAGASAQGKKKTVDTRIHWSDPDEGWVGGNAKKDGGGGRKKEPLGGRFADLINNPSESHYQLSACLVSIHN